MSLCLNVINLSVYGKMYLIIRYKNASRCICSREQHHRSRSTPVYVMPSWDAADEQHPYDVTQDAEPHHQPGGPAAGDYATLNSETQQHPYHDVGNTRRPTVPDTDYLEPVDTEYLEPVDIGSSYMNVIVN